MAMMTINVGLRLTSNKGHGPYIAEIIALNESTGMASLMMWRPGAKRKKKEFQLPISFLHSSACGWIKQFRGPVAAATPATRGEEKP